MRSVFYALLVLCTTSAFAWDCPTGQIRQQAPAGTPTTAPYYDVVEGIAFICVPIPTAASNGTVATATNTNTNTSTSSATGGNASSTATGGNASSNQTQGQKQGQSQSSVNSNQSAGGSVSNVGNSVTNVAAPDIPVNSAYAPPVFSTTNCYKGVSVGAQTPFVGGSFGGGGIDKNCAAERIAQDYFAMGNRYAACKVLITTKASKDAGITLGDCMSVPVVAPKSVVVAPPAPVAAAPITVNVPPAQLVVIPFPHEYVTVVPTPEQVKAATKPIAKRKPVHKPCPVTPLQSECPVK